MLLTLNEISAALRDNLLQSPWLGAPTSIVGDVMIDSRSVVRPESTLFFALRTPNNDGHAYIPSLIEAGVRNFVISESIPALECRSDLNVFLVDNTLAALQSLGAFCRGRLKGMVVGITGSKGKTAVKELIYQALESRQRVGRSPRSFNSQIGVPLSLSTVNPGDDVVLIEAGISERGEMERLARIVHPETGIITSITDEHDAGFADHAEKLAEKLRLFAGASTIIYNRNDKLIAPAVEREFAGKNLVGVDGSENGCTADNMLYAKELLKLRGYDEGQAAKMLEACRPVVTRLNVIEGVNNCKLIYDRFTSDTLSLRHSLDFMRRQIPEGTKRTLILATDGFIGSDHDIARAVTDFRVNRLITVGSRRPAFGEAAGNVATTHIANTNELTTDDFYAEAIMLKGSPVTNFDQLYATLEAKQHETLLEVSLDAIRHNFNFFRSRLKPTTGVICMLKAHGYGAGSTELARTLQSQGAAALAVAVVDEGVELRQAGITMPILVLNPRAQNYRIMFDYHLEPEIYSLEMLDEIINSATRYGVSRFPVHIKLETGMRRLGFLEEEMPELARRLAETDRVVAASVFSHLACADDPAEDDYTRRQFALFDRCCETLDSLLPYRPKRHILNSTGIIRFPEKQYDYVRLGIGLYGVKTIDDGSEDGLRNVSTLSTVIISLKHWKKGETIGYNRRGRLERDSVIATVPVGYADGLDRHLGYGNSEMLVNGKRCPTVGSICMDICMIDVTDVDCKVGDRVEVFGDNITPGELADRITTIPYEILTSISPRVKRVYYRD